MKKILLTLFLAIMLLPMPAVAQTWIEPSMQADGTINPGHWATTADGWQRSFATPGAMNPFTGQFNSYGRKNAVTSAIPSLTPPSGAGPQDPNAAKKTGAPAVRVYRNPAPASTDPNPNLIPGSDAPNPYSVLGSNPNAQAKR